jgi:hypothetical protein
MGHEIRGASMRQPPPRSVMLAFSHEMVFEPAEGRQHVVPAPTLETELAPVIVVRRLTPHGDHGVDGGRAADDLAPGISQGTPVEPRLRLGLKHPVGTGIADGEEITDRHVKPDPVVRAARFEQEDARAGSGR